MCALVSKSCKTLRSPAAEPHYNYRTNSFFRTLSLWEKLMQNTFLESYQYGKKHVKHRPLSEEALDLQPENTVLLNNRAMAYLKQAPRAERANPHKNLGVGFFEPETSAVHPLCIPSQKSWSRGESQNERPKPLADTLVNTLHKALRTKTLRNDTAHKMLSLEQHL